MIMMMALLRIVRVNDLACSIDATQLQTENFGHLILECFYVVLLLSSHLNSQSILGGRQLSLPFENKT